MADTIPAYTGRPDAWYDTVLKVLGSLGGVPQSVMQTPHDRYLRSLNEQQYIQDLVQRQKDNAARSEDQAMQKKRFGWDEEDRTRNAGLAQQQLAETYGEGARVTPEGIFTAGAPPAQPAWQRPAYLPENRPPANLDPVQTNHWMRNVGLDNSGFAAPQPTAQRAMPMSEQEKLLSAYNRIVQSGTDPVTAKQLFKIPLSPDEQDKMDERAFRSKLKQVKTMTAEILKEYPHLSERQAINIALGKSATNETESPEDLKPLDKLKLSRLYDQREATMKTNILGDVDGNKQKELDRIDAEINRIESRYGGGKAAEPTPQFQLPAPGKTPILTGIPGFRTPDAPQPAAQAAPSQPVKLQDDAERNAVARYAAQLPPDTPREVKRKALEDFVRVYREQQTAQK